MRPPSKVGTTPPRVGSPQPSGESRAGRAARKRVPRSGHAELRLPAGRDPVAALAADSTGRLPDLVPLRHARMLTSPWAFYRGSAAIMAADLAATPVSGLDVQLCGDAHLANFGFFATAERRMVFDLNDFDETLPGPFEWDVKRLAASLAVAARVRGFTDRQRIAAVSGGLRTYRTAMRDFATLTNLDVWYARLDAGDVLARIHTELDDRKVKAARRLVAKARKHTSRRDFARLVEVSDSRPRIRSRPPLVVPLQELVDPDRARHTQHWLTTILRSYRRSLPPDRRLLLDRYQFVDCARKVVGIGSVGTRCWIALFTGAGATPDPLFLQVKEARPSVLEQHLGPSRFGNAGRRVVSGQRLMQAAGDIFLGSHRARDQDGQRRDFYVRQLSDWKGSVAIDALRPSSLTVYAELCGWTLARAHARSGDRTAIAAYLGRKDNFDQAVTAWAESYAEQNDQDFAALAAAAGSGRIPAAVKPD